MVPLLLASLLPGIRPAVADTGTPDTGTPDTGPADTGGLDSGGGDTGAPERIAIEGARTLHEGFPLSLTASSELDVDLWTWEVLQLHGLDEGDFASCDSAGGALSCETIDDGELLATVSAWSETEGLLARRTVTVLVENDAPTLSGGADLARGQVRLAQGEAFALDFELIDAEGDGPWAEAVTVPSWASLRSLGEDGWRLQGVAPSRAVSEEAWLRFRDEEGGDRSLLVAFHVSDTDPDDAYDPTEDDPEPDEWLDEVTWGDGSGCGGSSCCGASVLWFPLGLLAVRRRRKAP
ncbi:MAG: hypothetical protein H6742_22040 [Alphaproteobacteria bacterium]|nr:hypothetical protein [Alphaproteobacteria bacterium]